MRPLFVVGFLLLACRAGAQHPGPLPAVPRANASVVRVTGEVAHPLNLTAAILAAMPQTTVTAMDKQRVSHSYSGVTLADIFRRAGVTTGKEMRGKNMTKYVLVSCADGYKVLFSLAELDSAFTDRVVILADRMDGKPLPTNNGPFRIIVPGEKRPARDCYKVLSITIRSAKD